MEATARRPGSVGCVGRAPPRDGLSAKADARPGGRDPSQ
ncbi:MAG: hypothetical protein HSCHL_0821 [Hydrogenibacillus schlegelii]|uniref:Uncharacterized protein n=1 Tax=Hydrogenibacillus schlegelii TaxID=1484 RepID=A0A2T5GDB3_HYDSH|nr:MAG: hypothetical protein HSCHL_0821 [Hydrogenibacillus schlegelii]